MSSNKRKGDTKCDDKDEQSSSSQSDGESPSKRLCREFDSVGKEALMVFRELWSRWRSTSQAKQTYGEEPRRLHIESAMLRLWFTTKDYIDSLTAEEKTQIGREIFCASICAKTDPFAIPLPFLELATEAFGSNEKLNDCHKTRPNFENFKIEFDNLRRWLVLKPCILWLARSAEFLLESIFSSQNKRVARHRRSEPFTQKEKDEMYSLAFGFEKLIPLQRSDLFVFCHTLIFLWNETHRAAPSPEKLVPPFRVIFNKLALVMKGSRATGPVLTTDMKTHKNQLAEEVIQFVVPSLLKTYDPRWQMICFGAAVHFAADKPFILAANNKDTEEKKKMRARVSRNDEFFERFDEYRAVFGHHLLSITKALCKDVCGIVSDFLGEVDTIECCLLG